MIALVLGALAGGPTPEFTMGLQSRPAGLALFGDLWSPVTPTLQAGPGLGVYFYWYELMAQGRVTLLDGFLVATLQAGSEPGWFKRAEDPEGGRTFMNRPLARARVINNVRNDLVWLFVRNTLWSRYRSFDEYNPFQDKVFQQGLEVSYEHSTALMFSPSGSAERKAWFYGEITLETSGRGIGWLDQRVRGGLIVEKLTPAVSIDLDFYYSLVDTKIGGPGVLFVLWVKPPPKETKER